MTWRFSEINVGTIGGGGGGVDPGGQATISVNFASSTTGDFSLASSASLYRLNTSRNLEVVSTNNGRFQCGTDGLVKGILLQRGTTSYVRNNRLVTTANGWTHNGLTTVSATRADIRGGTQAFEFEEASTTGSHNIVRTFGDAPGDTPDNTAVCLWAIVKYVDMPYVMLMFRDKANRFPWQRFRIDPDNRGIHTSNVGSAIQYSRGIEYMANNWYLIWASYDTVSATTPVHPTFHLNCVNAAGDSHSYNGATEGNRSFIVSWVGANLGTTPLINNVTSSHVTTTGDVLSLGVENQSRNDFYIDIELTYKDISKLTGTVAEKYIYQSGDFSVRMTNNTVAAYYQGTAVSGSHTFVPGSDYTIGVGKSPVRGLDLYVNGTLINRNLALLGDITPGTMYIGCDSSGANQVDCVIKNFEIGAWD